MARALRILLSVVLWLVAIGCLAAAIVPHFLDRIYYRGAESGHYDGQRFFNPAGEDTAHFPTGRGGRAGYFWRQLTGSDGRPAWPDTVPVQPAQPAELLRQTRGATGQAADNAEAAATPMRVTWVGHATVLVQLPGLNILTDPVWSDRAGPFGFGPARVAAPGIALADLPRIDLVLVSHNHYDHLDVATLRRLWKRDRPRVVTALGNDAILRSAGIPATALDWREAVTLPGRTPVSATRAWRQPVRVHLVRNHHWSSRWFVDRNRALWSAFVVDLPGGNLFFAGDTGIGDGRWMDEARALGPIRLALIPIGAFRFVLGQMESASHVGPIGAAEIFRRLGAWRGLAIHWGTFRLSREGWDTPPRMLRAVQRCTEPAEPIDRGRRFVAQPIGRPADVPPIRETLTPAGVPPGEAAVRACLNGPTVQDLP